MENQQQSAEDEHPNAALINSFCEITCSSKSEALFFLESHNFDLDSAVSTFLETATDAANVSINPTTSATTTAAINHSPSRSRSPSYSPAQSESSSHSRSRSPSPRRNRITQYNLRSSRGKAPSSSAAATTGAGRRTGGPIRTLADLNNRASNDDDESDTDPDFEPSEYYTGGEKSGMLVQDPSKGQDVDSIFSDARQLAVGEGSNEVNPPISNSKSFTGTARLLSGDTIPVPTPQQPEDRLHNITFWNNGFTVNDGPLRSFDDPQNAPFLESIRRSECPEELEPLDQNKRVHVRLMRKEENFAITERRQGSSFHGVGRTLGSTTEIIGGGSGGGGGGVLITAPAPAMGLIVDETRPITSIQLRLGDGTRMVSRFNIHHTIRDIRGFIDASRPGGPRAYQLQTVGFPPKQLVDLEQTIEQAGLANSVVIQNLC